MGERVVTGPGQQPYAGAGAVGGAAPRPPIPLSYADPLVTHPWAARAAGLIRQVGGPRQVLLAVGLAFVGAGIGQMNPSLSRGDASTWFFFGGLSLGFVIPVPGRKV